MAVRRSTLTVCGLKPRRTIIIALLAGLLVGDQLAIRTPRYDAVCVPCLPAGLSACLPACLPAW